MYGSNTFTMWLYVNMITSAKGETKWGAANVRT